MSEEVDARLRAATRDLVRSMRPGIPPEAAGGWGRRRVLLAAVVSVLVLGLVGGGVWLVAGSDPADPEPIAVTTPPQEDPAPGDDEPEAAPATPETIAPGIVRLDPGPLQRHLVRASAWTGEELFVWFDREVPGFGQGAAYRPASDEWRGVAPAPITFDTRVVEAFAFWTGSEVLVTAGHEFAAWDPRDDTWARFDFPAAVDPERVNERLGWGDQLVDIAAWTVTELIVHWAVDDRWFALEPTSETWRELPAAPQQLYRARATWTGSELIVTGAREDVSRGDRVSDSETFFRLDAMAFDPNTNTWRSLPHYPMGPEAHAAAWTGDEVVVVHWQGETAAFEPETSSWEERAALPLGEYGGGGIGVHAVDAVDGRVSAVVTGSDGGVALLDTEWVRLTPLDLFVSRDDLFVHRVGFGDGVLYVLGSISDDDANDFRALDVPALL